MTKDKCDAIKSWELPDHPRGSELVNTCSDAPRYVTLSRTQKAHTARHCILPRLILILSRYLRPNIISFNPVILTMATAPCRLRGFIHFVQKRRNTLIYRRSLHSDQTASHFCSKDFIRRAPWQSGNFSDSSVMREASVLLQEERAAELFDNHSGRSRAQSFKKFSNRRVAQKTLEHQCSSKKDVSVVLTRYNLLGVGPNWWVFSIVSRVLVFNWISKTSCTLRNIKW